MLWRRFNELKSMIDLYNDSFQNFHAQNVSTLFSHNLFKHGLKDLLHAIPNQEKKLEYLIKYP